MANPGYVRSTDGSDSDNGSTWLLANASASGAMSDQVGGDVIYLSDDHAESIAALITIIVPGDVSAPNTILCADDSAEPPTSLAATATIATTGANSITLRGSFYWYGTIFSSGSGTSNGSINMTNAGLEKQVYDTCDFKLAGNNASSRIAAGWAATGCDVEWLNCRVSLANPSQAIAPSGRFVWRGGSLIAGTASPTNTGLLVPSNTRTASALIDGVDLSEGGASMVLVSASLGGGSFSAVFRNCKLPSGWSGTLFSSGIKHGTRAELWNCSAGDINYAMWIEDYAGSSKHETTLVRSGGASDGDTPISWKMEASANAEYPAIVLRSPEIYVPNTTTGSSKTLTVEILHDSATALTDAEIWLEVEYLGTSGTPLALFADDAKADVLTSPANQTSSSETWDTTGMSNANKQKLSVSVTPQEEGVFICRVCLAKASKTVYIDPKVTVS